MTEISINRKKAGIIWMFVLSLLLMTFIGCKAREKIFTVGIVSNSLSHVQPLEGFKAGMAERGYSEGKNIKYIYISIVETDEQKIDAAIKELMDQNVDLVVTTGNKMSLRAKQLVQGTDMPVLFFANAWPVENGLVESLTHPGGNLTGVRITDTIPKALEWLAMIIPNAKKVYLPYNSDDDASIMNLAGLNNAASKLEIELVLHKIHSVEEAVEAIKRLPEDIDAIFMAPSITLNPRNNELSQAAISRGIPMVAALPLDEDVLLTFTNDFWESGKKTARLAQQILQGTKPADIPVESSEVYLTINLKTAEKIGLHISDGVLAQAKIIIR